MNKTEEMDGGGGNRKELGRKEGMVEIGRKVDGWSGRQSMETIKTKM